MKTKFVRRGGIVALAVSAALTAVPAAAHAVPAASISKSAPVEKPKPHRPAAKDTVAPLNAGCGSKASNLDDRTGHVTSNYVNVRTGSSTSCTSLGQAQTSHSLDYYCYTWQNGTTSWTYLKDTNTGVTGWIRDDNLSNNGSPRWCGF
jgi:hypothetical protein